MVLARLAAKQHGRVARWQIYPRWLSADQIRNRLASGHLHEIHRGVYAVGYPGGDRLGRWMGAILAGEPGALLSHRSAAALYGTINDRERTHVTTATKRRNRDGIVFPCSAVPADERAVVEGIPSTSISRTLLDLAGSEGQQAFGRACREAAFKRLTAKMGLPRLCTRYEGRRGTRIVIDAFRRGTVPAVHTKSELEDIFLELLIADGSVPLPAINTLIQVAGEDLEVDCAWPERRLVIELDGGRAHELPDRFEEDRRRDRLLIAAGWRVVRFTYWDVTTRPERTLAEVRRQLGLPAA